MTAAWIYPHRNLAESPLADGTPILRPTVPIRVPGQGEVHLGVLDSGSPVSVTSQRFVRRAGVDLGNATPVMEVPLGLAGRFDRLPVFDIDVLLESPDGLDTARWTLRVAVRPTWQFPFEILLGQRGWFDSFTTTFGPDHVAVEPLSAFVQRFRL